MNIMLVTVTERTREIGIRKAIGAAPRRHRRPVPDGGRAALDARRVGRASPPVSSVSSSRFVGVQPVVAPYSVFLAFGVSVAIGLFFGIYPANRAASLRPIDALRYE